VAAGGGRAASNDGGWGSWGSCPVPMILTIIQLTTPFNS
jgi:hypothetical protein